MITSKNKIATIHMYMSRRDNVSKKKQNKRQYPKQKTKEMAFIMCDYESISVTSCEGDELPELDLGMCICWRISQTKVAN